MSEKVKLPKEVADAIEYGRADVKGDDRLIQVACSAERILYSYDRVIYEWCNDGNLIKFVGALINGYEVEETPEDRVRFRYKNYRVNQKYHREKQNKESEQYWEGMATGILDALTDLGITIEGVND